MNETHAHPCPKCPGAMEARPILYSMPAQIDTLTSSQAGAFSLNDALVVRVVECSTCGFLELYIPKS